MNFFNNVYFHLWFLCKSDMRISASEQKREFNTFQVKKQQRYFRHFSLVLVSRVPLEIRHLLSLDGHLKLRRQLLYKPQSKGYFQSSALNIS